MSKDGWVKLHRKILESDMYQKMSSQHRDVLITILLSVNYERKEWDYKGKHYVLEPGQLVTSLEQLRKMCASDVTQRNVRTALQMMKAWGFLTNHATNQNRTLSICNWSKYQVEVTNEPSGKRQASDKRADKQVTNEPSPTKELRIKKKEESNIAPVPVALSEGALKWFAYWKETMGYGITQKQAENEKAAARLIKKYGTDEVRRAISILFHAKGNRFAPGDVKYTRSFVTLESRWDAVQDYGTSQNLQRIAKEHTDLSAYSELLNQPI